MATTSPKWRIALLSAAAFSTLVLILSASANRFRLYEWTSYTSNLDLTSQFEYQEPVIAGAPVQASGSDDTGHKHDPTHTDVSISSGIDTVPPTKPNQRIVGMVFAGRKEYVSILDCYLQRNLVRNGGWLDEVMWVMRTNKTSDIVYLDELTDRVPEYSQHHVFDEEQDEIKPPRKAYKLCHPNTLYIKIDDDVLFMEDHAISKIIQRKIDNPNYLIVSANVVNQPTFSWVTQVHLNSAKPYLPELGKPDDFVDDDRRHMVDWRASHLPQWTESDHKAKFDIDSSPPFRGHRWLPLPQGGLEQTPIGALAANGSSNHFKDGSNNVAWTVAAQQHYSFLDHLEKNELSLYKFDLWTYQNQSRNTNFFAFSGDDVVAHHVHGDDDEWWTVRLPAKLGRPAVLDGGAVAVYFGTVEQTSQIHKNPGRGLRDTDLLRRYRSYATEFICGKPWGSPMR